MSAAATRREERALLAHRLERDLGPFDPVHLAALVDVDRARFVRQKDVARASEDVPLALDDEGHATVSAPHAYLLSFRLLELAQGDRLVELGSGTGYGAALASWIVGPGGHVTTFEIEPSLAHSARELLASSPNVTVHEADAMTSSPRWEGATRVVCTFAIESIPDGWLAALPHHGVLVAPVGPHDKTQRLVRVVMTDDGPRVTDHGGVRYVPNRGKDGQRFGGSGA
jgi:protein-L-isoaspartate(D-aspartate) O-methyltransferase